MKNFWAEFIKVNDSLITNRDLAKRFQALHECQYTGTDTYDNYFFIDGWSSDGHWEVLFDLVKNRDKVVAPEGLNISGTTLFYNTTEGYCTDDIFKAIHATIDLCGLDRRHCHYVNCASNVQEMYTRFCNENGIVSRLDSCWEENCYNDASHACYLKPTVPVNELLYEDKKLYCCFNWNAWEHRLALIAALNYYGVIDDGYVTSPGINKFEYHPEHDWNLLIHGASSYLGGQPEFRAVMDRLPELKEKYPLTVDDRTTFGRSSDPPVYDTVVKAPLYEARINSLIEVITETRFRREHFFSEKTFWAISLGKPFIILNSVGSLKALRGMGYKTFSPFINEEYDLDEDNGRRTLRVAHELAELKKLKDEKPAQFKELFEEMQAIAQYNQRKFLASVK